MHLEKLLDLALEESIQTKKQFWAKHKPAFMEVGKALRKAIDSGNKILIFGNGGSACDAMHFSGELVNRYRKDRKALPCIALTADAPLITCIANDGNFSDIFSRQIAALGNSGDIAIGISTSGNSPNILAGLRAAREKKLVTIALLGGSGGEILSEKLSDHTLHVDSSAQTPRIQETHGWILHSLCDFIEFD